MSMRDDELNKSRSILSKSLPTSPIFNLMKGVPASPSPMMEGAAMSFPKSQDVPDFRLDSPVPEGSDSLERTTSFKRTARAVIDFKDIWISQ